MWKVSFGTNELALDIQIIMTNVCLFKAMLYKQVLVNLEAAMNSAVWQSQQTKTFQANIAFQQKIITYDLGSYYA